MTQLCARARLLLHDTYETRIPVQRRMESADNSMVTSCNLAPHSKAEADSGLGDILYF